MFQVFQTSNTVKLEDNLILKYYNQIKSLASQKIEVISPYFEEKRIIKNKDEIKKIKKAIEVIDKVF